MDMIIIMIINITITTTDVAITTIIATIITIIFLPVQMCQTQQEPILHSIKNLSLIPHIPKGQFLPRVLKHTDELGSGRG